MSADEETHVEEEETKLLNAEEVTLIATSFLKRLETTKVSSRSKPL